MTFAAIVRSMRLRTLPLSLSGVTLGIFIAFSSVFASDEQRVVAMFLDSGTSAVEAFYPVATLVFLLLTTVLLQILSNLSNELGDTLSGTDREDRQGVRYSLQDGGLTIPEMKRLIASVAVVCCLSGLLMVYCSFGEFIGWGPFLLLILGAVSVWAAMNYTLGNRPYGKGLDEMANNAERGRTEITTALETNLQQAHSDKPLSLLPQIWTDYKKDELSAIYKGKGTQKEKERIYELLMGINASQNSSWELIKQ